MSFHRERKSSSWSPKTPNISSPFTSRHSAIQPEPEPGIPLTPEQQENEAFQQQKFEATKLQLKQKEGSITPQEQEHLGVLQAKMDGLLAQRVERESRFGHNFAKVPVNSPDAPVSTPIQPKLTIGQPGDRYEQEADSVAHQVVNQINHPQRQVIQRQQEMMGEEDPIQMQPAISLHRHQIASRRHYEIMGEPNPVQMKLASGILQREEMPEEEVQMQPMAQRQAEGGMAATPDLEASIQQAKGSGQPLADTIREPMEQAFGADFSGVRVHADAKSDELNQSIQAKAFTTGQDVFFRSGAYELGSREGQELLAHELTHVVQQSEGAVQRNSREEGIEQVSPYEATKSLVQRDEQEEELKKPTEEGLEKSDEQKYSLPFIPTVCEGWLKTKDIWDGGYIVVREEEAKNLSGYESLLALKEQRKQEAQSLITEIGLLPGPASIQAATMSTIKGYVGINKNLDWEPLKAGQITLPFIYKLRGFPVPPTRDGTPAFRDGDDKLPSKPSRNKMW